MKSIALVLFILLTDIIVIALCKAAKRGDRPITEGAKEDEKTV